MYHSSSPSTLVLEVLWNAKCNSRVDPSVQYPQFLSLMGIKPNEDLDSSDLQLEMTSFTNGKSSNERRSLLRRTKDKIKANTETQAVKHARFIQKGIHNSSTSRPGRLS